MINPIDNFTISILGDPEINEADRRDYEWIINDELIHYFEEFTTRYKHVLQGHFRFHFNVI